MSNALATIGSVAAVRAGAPPRPPQPGDDARRREAAAAAGNSGTESVPEARAVARAAAAEQGRYQVRIHSDTLRMITEIVDMVTGDTLMYLPAGYRPDAEAAAEPAGKKSES